MKVELAELAKSAPQDTLLLEVPLDLINKNALLAWYAEHLRFPDYFGTNWDAFDECLNDLEWIREKQVIIFHRRLPLTSNRRNLQTYLSILANVARADPSGLTVAIAFDPSLEREVALARTA